MTGLFLVGVSHEGRPGPRQPFEEMPGDQVGPKFLLQTLQLA